MPSLNAATIALVKELSTKEVSRPYLRGVYALVGDCSRFWLNAQIAHYFAEEGLTLKLANRRFGPLQIENIGEISRNGRVQAVLRQVCTITFSEVDQVLSIGVQVHFGLRQNNLGEDSLSELMLSTSPGFNFVRGGLPVTDTIEANRRIALEVTDGMAEIVTSERAQRFLKGLPSLLQATYRVPR